MANCVDPGETALNDPSYLDLHGLHRRQCLVYRVENVKYDILKYLFPRIIDKELDITCELSFERDNLHEMPNPILCMKCQILFSGKP